MQRAALVMTTVFATSDGRRAQCNKQTIATCTHWCEASSARIYA
jgi:hypothetical protein